MPHILNKYLPNNQIFLQNHNLSTQDTQNEFGKIVIKTNSVKLRCFN